MSKGTNQNAMLCRVCGDVSSGLHYGVHTCESCKAFFKRSVKRENQGQAVGPCRSSGNCPVTWERKSSCQACRFAKSLAAGMRKELVRVDQTCGGRRPIRAPQPSLGDIPIDSGFPPFAATTSSVKVKEEPASFNNCTVSALAGNTLQLVQKPSQLGEYNSVKNELRQHCGENGDVSYLNMKLEFTEGTEECEVRSGPDPVLCSVCGDVSSGTHYGVYTCESCKAFFKRSVRHENQGCALAKCCSGGNCPVTWQRKSGCKMCRYAKCLAVGMKRDAVRADSLPGRLRGDRGSLSDPDWPGSRRHGRRQYESCTATEFSKVTRSCTAERQGNGDVLATEDALKIADGSADVLLLPTVPLVVKSELVTGTVSSADVAEEPTKVEDTSLVYNSSRLSTELPKKSSREFEYVSVKNEAQCDLAEENEDIKCPALKKVLLAEVVTASSQNAVLCMVCGDVSSGLHYGVQTCEGCKAFFKRSVMREHRGQAPSVCLTGGCCPVTWQRKTGCQACRYAKCLAAGMRRNAVRVDNSCGGRRRPPSDFAIFNKVVAKFLRSEDSTPKPVQADPLAVDTYSARDFALSAANTSHCGDVPAIKKEKPVGP